MEPIRQAFMSFTKALKEINKAFVKFARSTFTPEVLLEMRRAKYGGMRTDLIKWPESWQTVYCAGFLHSDCPSNEHDLQCTCNCHQTGQNK